MKPVDKNNILFDLITPYYFFQVNYHELAAALEYFNSPDGVDNLLSMRYAYRQEKFSRSVGIMIVNFATAGKMFASYSGRILSGKRIPNAINFAYVSEKNKLITNPNIHLLHLISDYYVHFYELPLEQYWDLNKSYEEKMAYFTINIESLLRFAKKKKGVVESSKQDSSTLEVCINYLASMETKLEVSNLIHNYYGPVNSFYEWLLKIIRDNE